MTSRILSQKPSGARLALKAVLPSMPIVGGLPGIRHTRGSLPKWDIVRQDVATDLSELQTYNEICGFARGNHLPATFPHIAAHVMHMTLMTDTDFPHSPLGAVHLRNSITQHRPIGREERYDLRLRAEETTPHPKGELVHLRTEATIGSELLWEETMSVLFRGSGKGEEPQPAPLAGLQPPAGATHWKLASDLGRKYGDVSGDKNPIHLYPWTAKAFGFPRHIAHGMWTKARTLAALQNRLPDSYTVDVEFKRPILLPSTVIFGADIEGNEIEFGVQSARNGAPHMVGRITGR